MGKQTKMINHNLLSGSFINNACSFHKLKTPASMLSYGSYALRYTIEFVRQGCFILHSFYCGLDRFKRAIISFYRCIRRGWLVLRRPITHGSEGLIGTFTLVAVSAMAEINPPLDCRMRTALKTGFHCAENLKNATYSATDRKFGKRFHISALRVQYICNRIM